MPRRVVVSLVGAALVSAAPYAAEPQDRPVFKSRSDLVVLHVNVFDGRSDTVPALTKDNFLVFEDDRVQDITFFQNEDLPVAVGLVVDNSSSMITRRDLAVAGGMAFAESSHPEDEMFTVNFNENVSLGLPSQFRFTSSRSLLRAALAGVQASGKTALHDAVIAALDHVETSNLQKHVVIVLSDGDDNASRHTAEEMYDRVLASDAIVYAVATGNPMTGEGGKPGVLRKLARTGGGTAYFPRRHQEVVKYFAEIAENIRLGYTIGYTPANTARDGGFRRVKVMVRADGRGKLSVQCRDGYRAPGPASSR